MLKRNAQAHKRKQTGMNDPLAAACEICGAVQVEGWTCESAFHQMLVWEFSDENGAGSVHHLSVLCYHLQHPQLYSPQGLRHALDLLVAFESGATPEQVREEARASLKERTWPIRGSVSAGFGTYAHPVHWTTHAPQVVAGGSAGYVDRVQAWSTSILTALRNAGEL